jgi:hypothetical protein
MEEYFLEETSSASTSAFGLDDYETSSTNNNNNNHRDVHDADDDNNNQNTTTTTTTSFLDRTNQSSLGWKKVTQYVWKWIQCIVRFIFDLISADNTSLVSILLKIGITISSYTMVVPTILGELLYGLLFLIDHNWYPLAVTTSFIILLFSSMILTSYEWMWRWQDRTYGYGRWAFTPRGGVNGTDGNTNIGPRMDTTMVENNNIQHYNYRPIVVVMDDTEIDLEEDLSMMGWMKTFGKYAGYGIGIWFPYCVMNMYINIWLWDPHQNHNQQQHPILVQLLACLAITPILVGAAILLYYAHPSFYRWHNPPPPTVLTRILAVPPSSSSSPPTDGTDDLEEVEGGLLFASSSSSMLWSDGPSANDMMEEGDSSSTSGLQRLLS